MVSNPVNSALHIQRTSYQICQWNVENIFELEIHRNNLNVRWNCKWTQNRPCKYVCRSIKSVHWIWIDDSRHSRQSTDIDKNAIMYVCVRVCVRVCVSFMFNIQWITDPWQMCIYADIWKCLFERLHFNTFSVQWIHPFSKVTNWKNLHHSSSKSNYYQNVPRFVFYSV